MYRRENYKDQTTNIKKNNLWNKKSRAINNIIKRTQSREFRTTKQSLI